MVYRQCQTNQGTNACEPGKLVCVAANDDDSCGTYGCELNIA